MTGGLVAVDLAHLDLHSFKDKPYDQSIIQNNPAFLQCLCFLLLLLLPICE
jgi:hypothetical protein